MKCFAHIDEDGKCSAFWVHQLAPKLDDYDEEYIPTNYGMDFPFDKIRKDEQVFIVDYSIMPEEMEELLKITDNVIWIDHHISAIKRYEGFPYEIAGLRYDGIAGCMLTYCYFKHMLVDITEENRFVCIPFDEKMCNDAPMFTKYVADFDVWKFEYGKDTKAFEIGLSLENTSPETLDSTWFQMYNNEISEESIIKNGMNLLLYRDNWSKEYCGAVGFETEFEGYKCFAINMAMAGSDNFTSVDQDKYDMFIGFSYNGKRWAYSLRSTKVNCSEIAMKYGGGGHPGAAGFSSDELLLKAIEE